MNHVITIYRDTTTGELAYKDEKNNDAWSLKAHRNDDITWNSQVGDFIIIFGERSPFDAQHFISAKMVTLAKRVRRRAFSGAYKYSVVVLAQGQSPEIDDPEICID